VICQYTQVISELSPIITVRLLFIHKTIGCVHQTWPRKETRHSAIPVSHALSDHHICHGGRQLGRHVKNGDFLHQAWIACQWIALLRCSIISTKC